MAKEKKATVKRSEDIKLKSKNYKYNQTKEKEKQIFNQLVTI